jgi:hypothetical protein
MEFKLQLASGLEMLSKLKLELRAELAGETPALPRV